MKENSGCGKNQPQKHRMTTRAAMAFLKRYLQQCKVIKEIGKRDRFKCMVFPCCNYEMQGIKWHLKDINYHRLHDHNGLPPLHRRKPGKRATGKYKRKTKKIVKNMVAKRSVDWHLKNSKYMYKSRLIERYCREEKDSTDVDGENPIQKKNANNNAMENKSVEEENTVEAYTSSAWVHEPPMQITPISIRTKESEGNDMNDKEKISTEEHKGKNMADPLIEVTDFAKVVEVEPGKPKNEAKDMAACEFTIGEKVFMFLEPDHAKKVGIAKIHATKLGTKCHGRSLERDCIVICVEESYVDDTPLHFPHIGADTVGESKKTYCIWFKDCLKAINQKEDGKETKNEGEQPNKLLVRNVKKLSSIVDSMQSIHKMGRASSDLQRNSEGDTEMQLSERIHSSQQQGKRLKDIKSAASVHTHLTPDEVKGNKRKVREWLEARNSIAVNKQRRNLKSSQI
ncbi:hypothetical protein KI387_002821 [Taxus chinensis]|uniref:Uncharacterized protein n=1 Tax=Taxus chinensis TaxID=29808 RepID=A0AA38GWS2_TAXCH|nr:hypothetical protein KI387_002821 [Taxus chinensis]